MGNNKEYEDFILNLIETVEIYLPAEAKKELACYIESYANVLDSDRILDLIDELRIDAIEPNDFYSDIV